MTHNDTVLFLDLEGAVIDNFDFLNYGNGPCVRKFIKNLNPSKICIFSFAIWDDKDIEKCRKQIIPVLNEILDCEISTNIMKVSDMRSSVFYSHNTFFDSDHDFSQCYGKDLAFMRVCPTKFPGKNLILIDDMVEDIIIENKTKNYSIEFINIDTLKSL